MSKNSPISPYQSVLLVPRLAQRQKLLEAHSIRDDGEHLSGSSREALFSPVDSRSVYLLEFRAGDLCDELPYCEPRTVLERLESYSDAQRAMACIFLLTTEFH